MIKKIKIEELKPGMHIHDLNCGWLYHPFVSNSMTVKDDQIIQKIGRQGIREVYIDTDKGWDVVDAPTEEEVREEIREGLDRVAEEQVDYLPQVSLREELANASKIKKEAKQTVHDIMDDVRFGRQVSTERIEPVVDRMIDSIFRNQDALLSLSRIRTVDEYTYTHSMTVGILMITFGKHLGFDLSLLREVGVGGILHDVGKMKVPMKILTSAGVLSGEDLKTVKGHVIHSRTLLEETKGMTEISILLASQHHERVDGSGYPDGLKGDEIEVYSQAAAIIDVYDAMTSDRCYQRRMPPTDVLGKLYEWSKYHFNTELVQHFVKCVGIYPIGSLVLLDNGFLAVVVNHGQKSMLQPVVRIIYNTHKDSHIIPYDVDLARPSKDGEQRIVSAASPDFWNINPEIYL
ncbi:MAG: HD-GYP domain-containing protein [Nitrospiraceae bacterium]|nr:MAG: HD-GYP domain-containing protein [Nitrospiraceae bacterium]